MKQIAQKFVAVRVLMLFMLSVVPFAFAESNSGESDGDVEDDSLLGTVESSTSVEASSTGVDVESDVEVKAESKGRGPQGDLRAERKEVRKEMKDERIELREEIKGARMEIKSERKDLQESRKAFHEERKLAREEMRMNRDEVLKIKNEYKKCDGSACDELKVKFNHGVKKHIEKLLEQIDRSFEQLTERVTNSGALSAEDKEKALADIAALNEKVALRVAEVQAMPQNATKEEMKVAVKDLQKFVIEVRHEQRKVVALLISSQVDTMIEKHTALADVMQAKIDELSAAGVDASALVELRAKFVAQTETIKDDQEVARDAWVAAESKDDKHAAWVEAHSKVKSQFGESRETLREFMKVYKELKSHTTAPVQASAEVETETEVQNATEVESETEVEVGVNTTTEVSESVDNSSLNVSANVSVEAAQ